MLVLYSFLNLRVFHKAFILFAVRECSVRREDKAAFDDDFFSRSGTDIKCEAEIGFVQAALGCKIKIRTINNSRVEMEIPPGTHSGTVFRLKGLGLKTTGAAETSLWRSK